MFYDGIENINIVILGNKPDQSGGQNDEWNVRWEFVMTFNKGEVLSTGGSDPANQYDFDMNHTLINPTPKWKQFFTRAELVNKRGMFPPAA